jgi:hypothetical protein
MISGYHTPAELRAVLAALAHERKTAGYSRVGVDYNPAHLASIERQEKIYQEALDEMLALGIEDEGKPEDVTKSIGRVSVGNLDHQYPKSMRRD